MQSLDVDNIGDCAIEAWNEEGMYYHIIIRTDCGMSTITTSGPVMPNVDLLPSGFKQDLYIMPYKEDKLMKTIANFLNDGSKKIKEAKTMEIEDAIAEFRDLKDYLERWGTN